MSFKKEFRDGRMRGEKYDRPGRKILSYPGEKKEENSAGEKETRELEII